MTNISFTVLGKPQPKGAHTSFVPRRKDGGFARRFDGRPVVVTKDTNPLMEASQDAVASSALVARTKAKEGIWLGPVEVAVRFYFARNQSDYGTGRNAELLKDKAPAHPVTRADTDKLARLVLDALTGTIIRDDKQVCGLLAWKLYAGLAEPPRTEVEVRQLHPETVGVVTDISQLALVA